MASLKEIKESYYHAGVDKLFYKTMIKDLFTDTCTVKFWDGEEVIYGEGESRFTLILNEPIPKADIIADPSLAVGEAYMNKKLDIEGDVQMAIESMYKNVDSVLLNNGIYTKMIKKITNNIKKSKQNVQHHYDIGNDFYKLWLDDTMTYSCGYFQSDDDTLTEAQKNKVNHILKKLALKEGQTLLDIGCGWGELIISAAKNYKVKALGITLSLEQLAEVKKKIKAEGLQDLVEVELVDYRELKNRKFDRIASVGMIEHVGQDHLHEYFSTVNNLLNEGGVSLLHCITGIKEGGTDSWMDKYIFPGGHIPAIKELIYHISEEQFYLLDVESLRRHYGRTLEKWARNFENALPIIKQTKDETFIRMWRLYLNSCAASFNCGYIDVHQLLFSKDINNDLPWSRKYIYQA
jgi:cyclopropane-fatty-acyl-phospholipid synthase